MKGLTFRSGRLQIAELEAPKLATEAVVRVLISGICSTDIQITKGYSGFEGVLGHEFVGIVEYSPDNPQIAGKRVVGEINVGCENCVFCRSGDPRHCPDRTVLGIKGRNGSHSEYLTLPTRNLFLVPENVSDEEAVFVEPLAAALGIAERIELKNAGRIAVIGDGKLGLLCSVAIKSLGADVSLFGRHRTKLEIAGKSGVETYLVSESPIPKREYDTVVEATGSVTGFEMAMDLVCPKGTIVLKSTYAGKAPIEAWRIVVDEISVVGSRCGRFGPALEWLNRRPVNLSALISEEFPLAEGVQAVEMAQKNGILKVLLRNK